MVNVKFRIDFDILLVLILISVLQDTKRVNSESINDQDVKTVFFTKCCHELNLDLLYKERTYGKQEVCVSVLTIIHAVH